MEFLGDIVCNPLFLENQIEAERDLIQRLSHENQRDQFETTIENAHYTVLFIFN